VHGAALGELRLLAWVEGVDIISGTVGCPTALVGENDAPRHSAETQRRSVIAPVGLPTITRAPGAIPRDRASSRRNSPPTGLASAEAKGARGSPASLKALPVNSILPDGVR